MNLNDNRINAYKKTAGKLDDGSKEKTVRSFSFEQLKKEDLEKVPKPTAQPVTEKKRVLPTIDSSLNEQTPKETTNKMRTHIDELMERDGLLKLTKKDGPSAHEIASDSIYRRVAKFLLIIGVKEAANILPHLPPEQVEKIIPEIASIRSVTPDEATMILAEFQSLVEKSKNKGGVDTAREILEKAFGSDMAHEMIEKSVPYPEGVPFEYLQDIDAEKLYFILKDEAPPVQTLVLSRVKPPTAAAFINRLDDEHKKDIVLRLAKMSAMSPDIIKRVDRAMFEKVQSIETGNVDTIDGRGALAEILKKMDAGSEKEILLTLSETDPDLGDDIRERLFTMEDVINADDRFIQETLRAMSEIDIAFLIAGKQDDFRNKILENVSKGRGDIILEEENLAKPMKKRDIDEITNAFFTKLRHAWEDGKLYIKGRDDEYV